MGLLTGFFEWLQPDPPEPPKPKVTGSEFQIQRPEKCQFVYGEFVRIEPHIVRSMTLTTTSQTGDTVPNNVMVVQLVWSQGEIQSIDTLYINDLSADGSSFALESGTTSNGFNFGGRVVEYFHVLDGGEKSIQIGQQVINFDGYGNAYSIVCLVYDESLMPNKPKFNASGYGKKIKNLSTGVVEFSSNAIDVYYDYCTNPFGGRIPESRFVPSQLLDERAFTKTQVTNADGDVQDMMTFNGVIDGNKKAIDNINAMRKQMRVFMPLIDGKYNVLIERPRTPEVFEINESNKMSDWSVSNVNSGDLLSKVIVKFKDRQQMGKEAKISYPEDGTDDNTITVTLDGCNNAYEAKQYAYIIYLRSISSRKASGKVNKSAIDYHVGQIIQYTEPRLGMVGKNWLITNKSVEDNIVEFDLIEYDESIYPWVAHPIPTYPIANVPDNRSVNKPTNIVKSEVEGDTVITWDSDYNEFDVQKIVGGVLTDLGTTDNKFVNLGNLPQGNHSLMVRAVNGLGYPSSWTEFAFTVNTPAIPTGLTVTDSYIEWTHPNLADIREFIIETTENTNNDTVAYSQPPSSNGTQRLEISGIKAGDYDVSVTAKGLNNLLSLPATLTNAQIDGITPIVTPIVNNVVSGFTDDPHTWSALNNFTGGLQKNGVEVTALGDEYLGGNPNIDTFRNYSWTAYVTNADAGNEVSYTTVASFSGGSANRGFDIAASFSSVDRFYLRRRSDNSGSENGVGIQNWKTIPLIEEDNTFTGNNTFTGTNNFTGQLLKNGSPVIGLEDLTYNSDESLAIAATTIEQFYKDQEAGLYDDFDQGVGSLAAGFVNSIINQANFLIANNGNIDKLKSSAIEVSGSGYALNQNPTWQDTLDGWDFSTASPEIIPTTSESVIVASHKLRIQTAGNKYFFSDPTPVSKEETYTVSIWVRQVGSGKNYLAVNFIDSSGLSIIGNQDSDATGWANKGTYHYHSVVNQPFPSSAWTKYEFKFGKNGDATIPTGAVACEIGMLYNRESDSLYDFQDYRIEKAMSSVHIENGSINADHLVLSGNGSINFATVGADQAGSAASAEANAISTAASDATSKANTAENNAKAYAFPAASAGALASLNSISSTHIDANAVTAPKILAGAVLTDKLAANAVTANKIAANAVTANKIAANAVTADKIEVNALVGKTIYAVDIQGDANEFGTVTVSKSISPVNTWVNLAQVKVPSDSNLERLVKIGSLEVTDGSGCSFQVIMQTQPIQSGGTIVSTTTIKSSLTGTGNNVTTNDISILVPADSTDRWYILRARNNVSGQSPSVSDTMTFETKVKKGNLITDAL